jgi:hypothetical protein
MRTLEAPSKVYLCAELAGTLMTPAEFDAVEEYDENYGYELVHGVLVVVPLPNEAEADPNEELGYFGCVITRKRTLRAVPWIKRWRSAMCGRPPVAAGQTD